MLNLNANEFTLTNHIFQTLETIAKSYGYEAVFTETFGKYNHKMDTGAVKIMAPSGDLLSLKSDPTPHATKQIAPLCDGYLKTYYKSSIVTLDHKAPIGLKESLQGGFEYYGNSGTESDAEIILLNCMVLNKLGVQNIHLDIGHIFFTAELIKSLNFSDTDLPDIEKALRKRSVESIKDLSLHQRKSLEKLLALTGSPIEVIKKAKTLATTPKLVESLDQLESIINRIQDLDSEQITKNKIALDLCLTHPKSYYTGPLFKVYSVDTGKTVAQGGRYDDLSKHFGYEFEACGGAIDIKNIIEVIKMKNTMTIDRTNFVLIYDEELFSPALDFSNWLRTKGFSVKFNLRPKDYSIALQSDYFKSVNQILDFNDGFIKVIDQLKNETYRISPDALKSRLISNPTSISIH
ncbi:MAG: ATP phosphoribosyltransferase regulatory subunit [Clostridia bacterium]|nr:ATP phosphoribosyltransferase regulatory subunit [Clostridia bacterium]